MSSPLFYRTVLDDGGYQLCGSCGEIMGTGDEVVCANLSDGLYFAHERCIQKSTPHNWRKELRYQSRDDVQPSTTAKTAEYAGEHTFGGEMSLLSKQDASRIAALAEHNQKERQVTVSEVVTSDRRVGGKVLLAGQPACARLDNREEPAKPVKLRNHAKPKKQTAQDDMLDDHFAVLQYLRKNGNDHTHVE